jgi:DNA-binding XRE family transcriptional regulator
MCMLVGMLVRRFALEIKFWRKKCGLSQATLAKKIGVNANTIYRWESQGVEPQMRFYVELGKVFDSYFEGGWTERMQILNREGKVEKSLFVSDYDDYVKDVQQAFDEIAFLLKDYSKSMCVRYHEGADNTLDVLISNVNKLSFHLEVFPDGDGEALLKVRASLEENGDLNHDLLFCFDRRKFKLMGTDGFTKERNYYHIDKIHTFIRTVLENFRGK